VPIRDERDAAMRAAIERAAGNIQPSEKGAFLERELERSILDSWFFCAPGGEAKALVKHAVPGWRPEPGHTDLVLGLLGDPSPTMLAELKVYKVEEQLWDLLKLLSIVEHHPVSPSAYLVTASTLNRWNNAEVAALLADAPNPEASETEWDARKMLEEWSASWRYLLGGGSGRPRDVPSNVLVRGVASAEVPAFPGYQVRCIGVGLSPSAGRLCFGDEGWPLD